MKRREIFEFRFAGRGVHALGGIGSIVGGIEGASAAKKAAKLQAKSAQAALDEQKREFDLSRSDTQPYRDAGAASLKDLRALMGTSANPGTLLKPFTGADLASDPGYQFGLQQGEQGINRAAAAAGRYDSGATLKDLLRFNADYAGTKFNDAFNRDQLTKGAIFNRLAGVAGIGQTGVGQATTAGMNSAANIGNLLTGQGNAIASGIVGSANSLSQGFSNAANYYQSNKLLKQLMGGGGGGGAAAGAGGYAGSDAGMWADLAGAGVF